MEQMMKIRLATPDDAESILKIYAPFIRDTAITFETEVPSAEDFSRRIERVLERYPYLVSIVDGEIVGYAYASRLRERAAYEYSVELSVYILPRYHGAGIARKLYDCLFALLREQGYVNSCAGYSEPNEKSARFHKKYGFTPVGTYHGVGYKFGRWVDVTWTERAIREPGDPPGEVRTVRELPREFLDKVIC